MIQPHVPVRLPCYDFTPLALHTFDASPRGAVGPAASGADDSGGVTGGVYKARERIHRGMLIRDRGVASLCTGHCSTCAALRIRGMMT